MAKLPITEFLRSRRARIRPEDAGVLGYSGIRRVPGLRREELAALAGISVDYYVRLEQGRNPNVSDAVLGAVATALRLDREERDHLFRLVRPSEVPHDARLHARPEVCGMLDWITAPVLVLRPCLDIIAWNRPATDLIADFDSLEADSRNLARLQLIDEDTSRRYPDRRHVAYEIAAQLRDASSRHPADCHLSTLIHDLRSRSIEFAHQWELYPVRRASNGAQRVEHPVHGELALLYEIALLPGDSGQMLMFYTAQPGSREQHILRQIAG
ncbi:helix-turn-helix transcriptional regulator [Nocardia wallacei]|uniref:helix-turn-helix transcriptional regulator n=1 Tax=Nocardia wallacei TaxID=480035 RepID=UPI00245448FB|nr:helix-turn-helix transcriptional regulator [Nocardia wallacei]